MRKLIAAAVTFVLLICGAWFVFANPFNVGVQKSEHFTEAKFDAIRNGERIDDVIRRLGKPVSITKNAGFPGLCRADECGMYAFTGSPAAWVIGHREAWVVVDRQGRVLHKLWNMEP